MILCWVVRTLSFACPCLHVVPVHCHLEAVSKDSVSTYCRGVGTYNIGVKPTVDTCCLLWFCLYFFPNFFILVVTSVAVSFPFQTNFFNQFLLVSFSFLGEIAFKCISVTVNRALNNCLHAWSSWFVKCGYCTLAVSVNDQCCFLPQLDRLNRVFLR